MINKINICGFLVYILLTQTAFSASSSIAIFGKAKYQENFKNFDYVNPVAPKGGSIKYGAEGTFNSLNPFILKGIAASGIESTFDSLMEGSADEISVKYPLIAKKAQLATDKKSIIFTLDERAKFHDGSKITVDDVIFSFDKISKEGHPSYQMLYKDVIRAEKIGKNQVKFIFTNNNNRELPILVASLPIISKKYYQNHEFNKSNLDIILGSGPYKVKKVNAGKSITYERVKDYWAQNLPVNKGRHNFDEISYDYYRDSNVLIEAFKSGNFDFRQENIARNWATAYNIDKVKTGQIVKKEIKHSLPANMQAFVFNLRREKFQNRDLRRALNYAFDFEWVQSRIFYNSYKRTDSFFANTDFASKSLPNKDEMKLLNYLQQKFPNDVSSAALNEIYQNPKTDSSGFDRKNLIKAKEILEKAGYFLKNGKLIDPKTNKNLTIEFLVNSKSFVMVIAPMKKNLAKLGIESKIRLVDDNQYQTRINKFDYDIIVNVFGQGLIPGNEQYVYWHSTTANLEGSSNLAGVQNKAVDYLVEKIVKTTKKEELQLYTKTLDRILLNQHYVIPQWHNNSYRILYYNKFSMPEKSPLYAVGIDSWWHK